MKVHELAKWLAEYQDQDAEVFVVCFIDEGRFPGYQQEKFDPAKHTEYSDFRGSPFTKPNDPWFNARELLLGSTGR